MPRESSATPAPVATMIVAAARGMAHETPARLLPRSRAVVIRDAPAGLGSVVERSCE